MFLASWGQSASKRIRGDLFSSTTNIATWFWQVILTPTFRGKLYMLLPTSRSDLPYGHSFSMSLKILVLSQGGCTLPLMQLIVFQYVPEKRKKRKKKRIKQTRNTTAWCIVQPTNTYSYKQLKKHDLALEFLHLLRETLPTLCHSILCFIVPSP